ncbi:MAG: glycosyltransferase family 2 protein [Desulfobacterales bacterium]
MKKDVSIIIPVKNEADNIAVLAEEIAAVMKNSGFSWENVWVDDGSTDATLSEIKRLHATDSRHRFLSLSTNFGQSAAMMAGFRVAAGDIFVTIDGDGQNDPEDIPMVVNRLITEKADMINGCRKIRQDSPIRKISSKIANAFRNRMTGEHVTDVGCSLRAFRRECVDQIVLFKGMHRFIPTLVRICGYTHILEVPVKHRPRNFGLTKYGIGNRLWVGLADTFAVRWMQRRLVFPKVKEKSE